MADEPVLKPKVTGERIFHWRRIRELASGLPGCRDGYAVVSRNYISKG
jgi:hypothetical protein